MGVCVAKQQCVLRTIAIATAFRRATFQACAQCQWIAAPLRGSQ